MGIDETWYHVPRGRDPDCGWNDSGDGPIDNVNVLVLVPFSVGENCDVRYDVRSVCHVSAPS
ncbi:MAG: hypothetical protein ACJA07_004355 [Rhodococcus sp. (in: high G+C Gram-positive bacteria)]|jgi:hypothetical protein